MLGRTHGKLKTIKPLRDGVIADFEYTEIMLQEFISRLKGKTIFSKPRIIICCPSNITSVEKNAIREAAERIGAMCSGFRQP
jgi:rod shape-determining protein MreB